LKRKKGEHMNPNDHRISIGPVDRRSFISTAGAGFGSLALMSMLGGNKLTGGNAFGAMESPMSAKEPMIPTKAKSVIFLFMFGGPSQMDLFDYKPELQRRDGESIENEFRRGSKTKAVLQASRRVFRQCGESGLWCSDAFPKISEHMDKLAVIKSLTSDSFAHGSALLQINSGRTLQGHPSLGSWVTYVLGSMNANLPGYVVMLDPRGGPTSGSPNWSSGYMPEARIASYELAYQLQMTAPEAMDLTQESSATLEMYGVNEPKPQWHPLALGPGTFGKQCLIARRLVERGVRFIQIYSGGGNAGGQNTWDGHHGIEENLQIHCPEVDQPIAALLKDLEQRGLLESTLVVWGGEFGRMPVSETFNTGGKPGGRDHNPKGFTYWFAGAGVKAGTSYGETDELGEAAVENPRPLRDLHATILHLMGLDHKRLTYFHGGLDEKLTGVLEASPIREIMA